MSELSTEEGNALVLANMAAAKKLSHRFYVPGYEPEDKLQEAAIGLIMAARRFNPNYGVKFITFAWRCMETELRNAGRRQRRHFNRATFVSNADAKGADTLRHIEDYREAGLSALDQKEVWRDVMTFLNERERLIITRRFREACTLDEVGRELGVSKQRVQQIELKALEWVRQVIKSWEKRSGVTADDFLRGGNARRAKPVNQAYSAVA